ncbi:MAG: PAS domain S-box protein [Bacteroidales bacterium]|nr:PAS domain S-box protein [Bacteroidales bacterium]
MKNKVKLKLSSKGQVVFYITIITVIFAIGGYWYYGREKEQIIQQKERTLSAIATLKAKQVEMWYKDEFKDAQIISANPWLGEVANTFVGSNSPVDSISLLELLKQIQLEHEYDEVILTSLDGNLIASTNSHTKPIHPDELSALKIAIQKGEAVSTDFFTATQKGNKQSLISFISLINSPNHAIILRVDAANDILPIIESWPIESQTGESFIFSIETNNILFFSETKHQVEIETRDKLMIKDDDLLSKIHTSGQPGIFQGKDYRNVDVLASMSKIEGTNCVLIAKVDKSKLLQELSGEALSIIAWVLLLVALSGLFIAYWFNTRQKNIYKGLLEKEQELWLQQEKFNVVMDSIGDGIITLDLNGTIQYINNRAEALTGWNLREARGRDYHEVYNVINEDTGQQENNILNKVLKNGLVKELANHTLLISKSGSEIPVMDTGAPLFDSSGKITGIAISFQDETEKRTQSRLLKQSEEKYRILVKSIPQKVFVKNLELSYIYCNESFTEDLGITPEEIAGKTDYDFFSKEMADKYRDDDIFILEKGESTTLEEEYQVNNINFWVRTTKTPVKNENGTTIGLLGIFEDITEKKRAQIALMQSEESLREFFEADLTGDYSATSDGEILQCNSAFVGILGYASAEDIIGRNIADMYQNPVERKEFLNLIQNQKVIRNYKSKLKCKDGTSIICNENIVGKFDVNGNLVQYFGYMYDITDQIRAEEELRKSEEKYRLFFENDITGNYHTTLDGKILTCNTAFVKMLKYKSKEEICAINTSELYFGNPDRDKFINKVRTEKKLQNNELTLKAYDGSEVEIIENVVGVFDETGELKEIVGYMSDITDKIHTEKELLKKDQLLSSVMETQQELICRFLPDTTLTFVNKAYCNIFEMNEQELIGSKFLELVPKNEWDEIRSVIKKLNADNSSQTYVSSANKPDGSVMLIEWIDTAILNEKNEVIEFQSVGRDITEKLKAEQELLYQTRMQELLRKIALDYINIPLEKVDSTIHKSLEEVGKFVDADRVYVFDYDWDNNVCNNTYEWCGDGITPQINNLQNVPLEDIPFWVNPHKEGKAINIPDVFALHESDAVRQILEPQGVKSLITIPIMDETKCIGFLGFDAVKEHHIYQENDKLLLFVFAQMFVNIKKRSIIEQKLIKAKEKAEESDKLKTAFINNISHEIRTPLNAILGFGGFMAEMELSQEEKKEMLAHVNHSSNRLMNTVTDYMDIAMIVSGTMRVYKKDFQLQAFLEEVIEKTQHLCADKDIVLEIETLPAAFDLIINSDREIIRKIMDKLLDNAIKFTHQGKISFGYRMLPGFVELFVQDTGKGIGQHKLEMIFEIFAQEDSSMTRGHEGSGLGLSIADGLVKLLGGTMSVTSEKGKGSIFTFTVPYGETVVAEKPVALDDKNDIVSGKPLVLIAEDDELSCKLIAKLLKQAGCDYLQARNGLEAVELCKQHPAITLVLMDIKMPVMNGLEATKLIREFHPKLPIIAITAHAQTGDEPRFLAAGCNGYISKPFGKDKLFKLLQNHI